MSVVIHSFTAVPCGCGGDICGRNRDGSARKSRYRCHGCRRWVPWCFGSADDLPHHCDDCWASAHAGIEIVEAPGNSSLVLYDRKLGEVWALRTARDLVGEHRLLVPFETCREHIERYRANLPPRT